MSKEFANFLFFQETLLLKKLDIEKELAEILADAVSDENLSDEARALAKEDGAFDVDKPAGSLVGIDWIVISIIIGKTALATTTSLAVKDLYAYLKKQFEARCAGSLKDVKEGEAVKDAG